MRTRRAVLALAAAWGVVLAAPGTSWAVAPPAAMTATADWDQAAADRFFVQWLSSADERPAVRSAARGALLSGDAAVQDFLVTGWDAAIGRAAATKTRNVDFTTRMVNTHPAQYYPWVNAAGLHALAGSDAALQEFVTTGYAKALELDRKNIAYDKGQQQQVLQDDRDFVTRLSVEDPGAQVRAWAGRAVASGTADTDVVEFFRYGWVSASDLDMQMFHNRMADSDRQWRVTSRQLVNEAQDAEKAARATAGEAQAQMRAAAARAWAQVGAQTGPARVAWADAEQTALRQADTWLLISQAAGTATGSNWLTIAGTAPGTRTEWLAEQENAGSQAATWRALYQQALAAEAAMSDPIN